MWLWALIRASLPVCFVFVVWGRVDQRLPRTLEKLHWFIFFFYKCPELLWSILESFTNEVKSLISQFDLNEIWVSHSKRDLLVISQSKSWYERLTVIMMCLLSTSCPSSTMGKKSRVKTQKSGSGASAVVSPKEMMNLISELLQSMFIFNLHAQFTFTLQVLWPATDNVICASQSLSFTVLKTFSSKVH